MSTLPEASRHARVGYLGPAGTFSEEALLASAAADAIEPVALASIYETVMALREGDVRWAIVPIENSLEGSINVTLDLLAGDAGDVEIVGEALLRVRHSLIGTEAVPLAEIETVITHPQVPGQCTLFLRSELPQARILAAGSTAEAVRSAVLEILGDPEVRERMSTYSVGYAAANFSWTGHVDALEERYLAVVRGGDE